MASSPFHGIFSALGQGTNRGGVFHAQNREAEGEEPQQDPAVGKVAVDIFEQDDYMIIKAPIAGVRMSDIDIEVNENVLTIRGSRRQGDDVPEGRYFLRECFWGPFARRVTLPGPIDARKVRATFSKDCILKILIPREEKVKIVKINEA